MCISPKKILNRSLHFSEGDSFYLRVPCGKCSECRNCSRNDWFVRCFYEWRSSAQSYFYTLTYNNDFLPHSLGYPCFSKRDVQLFIKLLRKRLVDIKLKYMITCEYGEKYGRPHYHALFFLSDAMSEFRFHALVQECWCHSSRDSFGNVLHLSRGFVKQGDNMGLVSRDNGIMYVTKYITKDFGYHDISKSILRSCYSRLCRLLDYYYSRYGFKDIFFKLSDASLVPYAYKRSLSESEKEFASAFVAKFNSWYRPFVPFHLQSTKLGMSFVENNLGLKFELDHLNILRSNGQIVRYKLPRYFARKFWYDVVESETTHKKDRFVLSDAGKSHFVSMVAQSVPTLVDRYNEYCSPIFLNKISFEFFKVFESFFGDKDKKGFFFHDEHHLRYFLNRLSLDLDFEVLAIYKSVFRDRVCYDPSMYECCCCDDYIKSNYLELLDCMLDYSARLDFGKLCELDRQSRLKIEYALWNNTPKFASYELALQVFDSLSLASRSLEAKFKDEQEVHDKSVRDILRAASELDSGSLLLRFRDEDSIHEDNMSNIPRGLIRKRSN